MKTTPGPWKVNTSGGMTYVENFYGQSVCRVSTSGVDATLIAAVPDLLAALDALYRSFQHTGNAKGDKAKTDIITLNPDVKAALNHARVTIAKVTAPTTDPAAYGKAVHQAAIDGVVPGGFFICSDCDGIFPLEDRRNIYDEPVEEKPLCPSCYNDILAADDHD